MARYQLNAQLAQKIVQRTMSIIDCNINIMNIKGVIIASGNIERIGDIHDGALLAILQERTVNINQEKSGLLGIKTGINLPLRLEGEIIGVIGLTGAPSELDKFAELVKMAAEMMVEQAYLSKILAQNNRLKEELIQNLIKVNEITPELSEWANRFNIDLSIPRIACIIEINSRSLEFDEIHDKLQMVQELLAASEQEYLIAIISLTELVVLKPALNKKGIWNDKEHIAQIKQLLQQIENNQLDIRVSLGHYFTTTTHNNIALSFYTAKTTLKVGKDRYPKKTIYNYQELSLPVLLNQFGDSWQKQEFSRLSNKLMQQDSSGILQKTLLTWFENNMHTIATAKALYIHRNTLEYRLNKISQITGIDLSQTDNRILLYIALNIGN